MQERVSRKERRWWSDSEGWSLQFQRWTAIDQGKASECRGQSSAGDAEETKALTERMPDGSSRWTLKSPGEAREGGKGREEGSEPDTRLIRSEGQG